MICFDVKSKFLIALGGPAAAAPGGDEEITVWTATCWKTSIGKSESDFGGRTRRSDASGTEAIGDGGERERKRKKKVGLDYDVLWVFTRAGVVAGLVRHWEGKRRGRVSPENW